MSETFELFATLNDEDERPLREWLAASGARLLRAFSPTFPLEEVAWDSLEGIGRDECLALWYDDVFRPEELAADYSRDFGGVYYESWNLPVITYQRQWYWKHGGIIFTIRWDCTYRAFRLNWPEENFEPEQIADFERRLLLLRQRFEQLRMWLAEHYLGLGSHSFLGKGAVSESEELRQFHGHLFGL